jgi:hypothetical protein
MIGQPRYRSEVKLAGSFSCVDPDLLNSRRP